MINPVLRKAQNEFSDIDLYAFLDDITVCGDDPLRMADCIRQIRDGLRELGLELNSRKCEWYGKDPCPFEDFHKPDGCIRVVGSFHGQDEAVEREIFNIALSHEQLFRKLKAEKMPLQLALTILRASVLPKLQFLLRVHAPHLTERAAIHFDRHVEDFWAWASETTVTNYSRKIAKLPTTLGGAGFTRFAPLRQDIYEASRDACLGIDGPRQNSRILEHMKATSEELRALDANTAAPRRMW